MICVLCEPEDDDALWLAAALRRQGEDVDCVLPEELMVGSALTCRIDSVEATSTLRLRDGRVLDAGAPRLVVNRLVDLPAARTAASAADARYLAEEWRAATAAWLRTMRCPVLNPPRAACLAGPLLAPTAWRAVGSACGLPVSPWRSDRPVEADDPADLVWLAGRCIDATGTVPPGIGAGMERMSRHVGAPLLGATFDRANGRWTLLDATPRPRLAPAGAALVAAVVALVHRSESSP